MSESQRHGVKDCKGSGDEKHFHRYLYVVRIMEMRDVLEKSKAKTQTIDHSNMHHLSNLSNKAWVMFSAGNRW